MAEFSAQFQRAIAGEIEKLKEAGSNLRQQAEEAELLAQQLRGDADSTERRATELEELLGTAPQLSLIQKNGLGGADLRQLAIEILARRRGPDQPVHYREWFELVASEGHEVGGKDPLASFLTQISRSPLVVKDNSQSGVYRLRGHDALAELQAELQAARQKLAGAVERIDMAADGHLSTNELDKELARKKTVETDVGRLERQIAEARRTLDRMAA
jgi:hypothetical protein